MVNRPRPQPTQAGRKRSTDQPTTDRGPFPPLKPRNDRRTGALLAGLGVALAVPCALIGQTQVALFGLAPVLLGVVYFLVGTLLPSPSQQ